MIKNQIRDFLVEFEKRFQACFSAADALVRPSVIQKSSQELLQTVLTPERVQEQEHEHASCQTSSSRLISHPTGIRLSVDRLLLHTPICLY